jgi:hypothetical protein
LGLGSLERRRFEAELENGFDVPISSAVEVRCRQRTRAGSLESSNAVPVAEADHTQYRSIGKLGSRVPGQHPLDNSGDARAKGRRPRYEPRWWPLSVLAVCVRAVLIISDGSTLGSVTSRMRRDALAA